MKENSMNLAEVGISEAEMAPGIDLNLEQLLVAENPRVYELGHFEINNHRYYAVRAHHGSVTELDEDGREQLAPYSGGTRLMGVKNVPSEFDSLEEFVQYEAQKLAHGMTVKFAEAGMARNGGKAVIATDADPSTISFEEKQAVMVEIARRAELLGIAGNTGDIRSIFAPDMYTGNPGLMDTYVNEYFNQSKDPFYLAAAASKIEGGNKFRADSTSYTTFLALERGKKTTEHLNPGRQSVKLMGAGGVGGPFARFVEEDESKQFEIDAISDVFDGVERTIYVPEYSGGIPVTSEFLDFLAKSPGQDKILVLMKYLGENHPDVAEKAQVSTIPGLIYSLDSDWFVLAGPGNVLNEKTVPDDKKIVDSVARLGVISAANHGYSDIAYERLKKHGKIVPPCGNTNQGGGVCSSIEIRDNMIAVTDRSYEATRREVAGVNKATWHQQERLGVEFPEIQGDGVRLATVYQMGQRAVWNRVSVSDKVSRHVQQPAVAS